MQWLAADRKPSFDGRLVWYHDGSEERLSYLPAEEESGNERCIDARRRGRSGCDHPVHAPNKDPQQALNELKQMTPMMAPDGGRCCLRPLVGSTQRAVDRLAPLRWIHCDWRDVDEVG